MEPVFLLPVWKTSGQRTTKSTRTAYRAAMSLTGIEHVSITMLSCTIHRGSMPARPDL